MDPVSLSLGVAALFKTCIDCFEYFKAASDFSRDYEVLLVKLEFEQERLLVWGDLVGITNEDSSNADSKAAQPDLVERCLASIGHLLQDTETLKSNYGVRPVSPSDRVLDQTGVTVNALKRFRLRFGRTSQGHGIFKKTRWAIYDAAKFEKLVSDIRDLVDKLLEKMPQHALNKTVQDDIAIMIDDVSGLRLIQEACEETYPDWSDAASVAIDVSEAATVDNRLADERIAQFDHLAPNGASSSADKIKSTVAFGDQSSKIYGISFK